MIKPLKNKSFIKKIHDNISYPPIKLAIYAILIWSTQAVILSKSYNNIDFSAILFPAFFFSSTYLLIFKLIYSGRRKNQLIDIFNKKKVPLIGTFLVFGYHFFLYWGLQKGPQVETNLINFLWPLFFFIIAYFLFSKKNIKNEKRLSLNLSGYTIIKIIIGFVGVIILFSQGQLRSLNFIEWNGPILGLGAAIFWAIFSVYLRMIGNTSHITIFIFGTAVLCFVVWLFREAPPFWSISNLLVSLYMGIFPLGIAMQCWEKALREDLIEEISVLAFFAPFLSTIFLFLAGFGKLTWYTVVGGSMIVLSNMYYSGLKNRMSKILNKSSK